ncbi:hypothetical protein OnM2_001033, partial [Erysiphe neolycopersici]
MDKPILRKIRDYLRENGVYVIKEKRYKIAKALAQVAVENDPSVWSVENIKEQLEKEGKFNSYRNKLSSFSTLPPTEKIKPENQTAVTSIIENFSPSQLSKPHQPSTGRELTDFGKCYTNDMKYGGSDDRFDYKLSIFYDVCNRTQLSEWQWKSAIPIMLKSRALVFYYRTLLPKINTETPFQQIINNIRNNFEGESYKRLIQQQWRKVNIASIIEINPEKSLNEHLETMIETLQDLQLGLDSKYRDDDYLRDKLIQACEGNPAFQNACYRPAPTLEEFINDLRSSVLAHEKSLNLNTTNLFTERRFYKNNQSSISRYNKNGKQNYYNKNNRSENSKKCYICKQVGCWSSKHSDQEREIFKRNLLGKVSNRINQFIIDDNDDNDFMMENNNEIDELSDKELETFISTTETANSEMYKNNENFFTSFGQVNGIELITTLCNNTTFHNITKDSLKPSNDPFTYVVNDSSINAYGQSGRYNKNQFYGILIDTGASLRSTAGYGQYLAYKQLNGTTNNNIELDTSKTGLVNVQFGIGSTSSLGSITIDTPLGLIEFHVVNADIPFLLCLYDMDRLQVKLDNLNNVLLQGDKSFPVVRRFGHIFLLNKVIFKSSECFLSTIELRRLHRRFGHPSADRLYNLLKNSNH